jgi:Fe-S cluster assembly protein SufD
VKVDVGSNQSQTISLISLKDFREDLTINLNGVGAAVIVGGMLTAKKKDQVIFNIEINHNAPDTNSDIFIRTVLYDQARVDLRGMVRIAKGAKGTNTFLKEDALILSPDATAFALPSLEIDENDVKAGHSSTVGPVDQDQIFFLMSRGIPETEATKMLVDGYFAPVLAKLNSEKEIYEKRS